MRLRTLSFVFFCLSAILCLLSLWLWDKHKRVDEIKTEFLFTLEKSQLEIENATNRLSLAEDFLKLKSWGLDYALKQKLLSFTQLGIVDQFQIWEKDCQPWANSGEVNSLPVESCSQFTKQEPTHLITTPDTFPRLIIHRPISHIKEADLSLIGLVEIGPSWVNEHRGLKSLFERYQVSISHKQDHGSLGQKFVTVPVKDSSITLLLDPWWVTFIPQYLLEHPANYGLMILTCLLLGLGCAFFAEISLAKQKAKSDEVMDILLYRDFLAFPKELPSSQRELSFSHGDWQKFMTRIQCRFDELNHRLMQKNFDGELMQSKFESLQYEIASLKEKQEQSERWQYLAEQITHQGTSVLQTQMEQVDRLKSIQNSLKSGLLHESQALHQLSLCWHDERARAKKPEVNKEILSTVGQMIDQIIHISLSLESQSKDQKALTNILSQWCALATANGQSFQ